MAYEEPNALIAHLYYAGLDEDDMQELKRFVEIARRAPGYDKQQDLLLAIGV